MYKKIKEWYEKGFWSYEMVWEAVPKLITEEEAREITQGNPPIDYRAKAQDYEQALSELGVDVSEEE